MSYNENPSYLQLAGGTMTGALVLNADPLLPLGAATKQYVDAISAGLNFKTAVTCGTTANLNATYLNGSLGVGATLINAGSLAAFTVDGITPTINQRVLVKNQTTTFQNGIYTITTLGTGAVAWILTRATDYDQAAEIKPGDLIPVSTGSTLANTTWLQTGSVATIGSDPITFQQYQSTPVATTQYDVLVGGASNTIVSIGPGSAGQVLQSGGNASNPVYSTATYPATAGTSGNVLKSDGTNVASATPTTVTFYMVCPTSSNPADSTTYFLSSTSAPLQITTTVTVNTRLYFPIATTIRAVAANFHNSAGTLGSNENSTVFIRVNGSTDTNITTTLQLTATDNPFTVSGLAIVISAGDYISIGVTTPAWVTNPTNINATISISAW